MTYSREAPYSKEVLAKNELDVQLEYRARLLPIRQRNNEGSLITFFQSILVGGIVNRIAASNDDFIFLVIGAVTPIIVGLGLGYSAIRRSSDPSNDW